MKQIETEMEVLDTEHLALIEGEESRGIVLIVLIPVILVVILFVSLLLHCISANFSTKTENENVLEELDADKSVDKTIEAVRESAFDVENVCESTIIADLEAVVTEPRLDSV